MSEHEDSLYGYSYYRNGHEVVLTIKSENSMTEAEGIKALKWVLRDIEIQHADDVEAGEYAAASDDA